MHNFVVAAELNREKPIAVDQASYRHLLVRATVTAPTMEAAGDVARDLCQLAGDWLVTIRDPATGKRASFAYPVPDTRAA